MSDDYVGTVEEWVRIATLDLVTARRIFELHRPMPHEIICSSAKKH